MEDVEVDETVVDAVFDWLLRVEQTEDLAALLQIEDDDLQGIASATASVEGSPCSSVGRSSGTFSCSAPRGVLPSKSSQHVADESSLHVTEEEASLITSYGSEVVDTGFTFDLEDYGQDFCHLNSESSVTWEETSSHHEPSTWTEAANAGTSGGCVGNAYLCEVPIWKEVVTLAERRKDFWEESYGLTFTQCGAWDEPSSRREKVIRLLALLEGDRDPRNDYDPLPGPCGFWDEPMTRGDKIHNMLMQFGAFSILAERDSEEEEDSSTELRRPNISSPSQHAADDLRLCDAEEEASQITSVGSELLDVGFTFDLEDFDEASSLKKGNDNVCDEALVSEEASTSLVSEAASSTAADSNDDVWEESYTLTFRQLGAWDEPSSRREKVIRVFALFDAEDNLRNEYEPVPGPGGYWDEPMTRGDKIHHMLTQFGAFRILAEHHSKQSKAELRIHDDQEILRKSRAKAKARRIGYAL